MTKFAMSVMASHSTLMATLGLSVAAFHAMVPALDGMTPFNPLATHFAMTAHIPIAVLGTALCAVMTV